MAGSRHSGVLNVARSLYVCYLFNVARHLIFQRFLLAGGKCQAVSVKTERLGIRFCDGRVALMLVAPPQKYQSPVLLSTLQSCQVKGTPHLRDKIGKKTLTERNLPPGHPAGVQPT